MDLFYKVNPKIVDKFNQGNSAYIALRDAKSVISEYLSLTEDLEYEAESMYEFVRDTAGW